MTAETAAFNPAVAGCTVEITDVDENVVIAFIAVVDATTTATTIMEKS